MWAAKVLGNGDVGCGAAGLTDKGLGLWGARVRG